MPRSTLVTPAIEYPDSDGRTNRKGKSEGRPYRKR